MKTRAAQQRNAGVKPRIFVVDSDESIRTFLCMALTDEGYAVLDSGDAATACSLVQTFRPHVILLEVLSPGNHEALFLSAYRQIVGARPPIIGMTTPLSNKGQAARLGLTAVVSKPFYLAYLLSRVRRLGG